jgi:FMN-dependent NADH-azoreductase
MKLLHIDSSIQGEGSATRELTGEIVRRAQRERPGLEVIRRDLATNELPHLSLAALARTDELAAARDAAVLDEFLGADVIVIGAPLYNFSIPSQLKAWIDRISVAGKTFRYTANGPVGLAGGKELIIAVARGGVYGAGGPPEFGESYLRFLFGFLGITEVTFVRAEGLSVSAEERAAALARARAAIAASAPLAA